MSKLTIAIAFAVLGMAICASGSSAAKTTTNVSPCTAVHNPVWSPDGTQIAYYGTRWPRPKNHSPINDVLQALCTMDANGQNVQPLANTVCHEKCNDFPYQIDWLPSGQLLYLIDGDLYLLAPGGKPKQFARVNSDSFTVDKAGDRLAAGYGFPGCLTCGGPLSVLRVPSGRTAGKVGGKTFNIFPSLSPDGKQVVFERDASDESGRNFGIWTAKANGKGLRQLVTKGFQPLWSPAAGGKIAYRGYVKGVESLQLISPTGHGKKTLVSRRVQNIFGWSPDGKSFAFEIGTGTFGKLAVVDVATGKIRQLLKLYYSPMASWAPDSSELVASSFPDPKQCASVYSVPAAGGKPTLLTHC